MSRVTCKCIGYWRIAGCQSERHPPSRRETDAAELQGGTEATSGGEFQVYPGESEADAVFAGGVCAETADSCENAGEVGAGAGQAESAGGGTGAAGA